MTNNHKDNFQIADILLEYGSNSIIGEIIDDFEHSKYSHTAGIVSEGELIEANGFKKTGYIELSVYKNEADIFTCDILTEKQRKLIVKYVKSQVGTTYDWVLLFEEAFRFLFNLAIPHKEFHNHICSTLWADAYRHAGIDLTPGIRYPSPSDLSKSKLLRRVSEV